MLYVLFRKARATARAPTNSPDQGDDLWILYRYLSSKNWNNTIAWNFAKFQKFQKKWNFQNFQIFWKFLKFCKITSNYVFPAFELISDPPFGWDFEQQLLILKSRILLLMSENLSRGRSRRAESKIISLIKKIDWRSLQGCARGWARVTDQNMWHIIWRIFGFFQDWLSGGAVSTHAPMRANRFSWSRRCFLTTWLLYCIFESRWDKYVGRWAKIGLGSSFHKN